MESKFKIGDRVKTFQGYRGVIGSELVEFTNSSGSMPSYSRKEYLYLVKLSKGFYSEDKETYVSILVCHPDSLSFDLTAAPA